MQNDRDPDLAELRAEIVALGGLLGLTARAAETPVMFVRRCQHAAKLLHAGAGVTWHDYVLIKADKGEAVFMLKEPPESSPLGGPRWGITVHQGLEELAGKIGLYEDTQR